MLRYVLLALIAEDGPLHGYALMKVFAGRSGIRLSIGNVYRELQRLRTDKYIEAVENPADADPRRAPYAITDAGRVAMTDWLTMPAESFLREPVDPLYCRLVLLANADTSQAMRFLDDLAAELAQQTRVAERRRLVTSNGSSVLPILAGRRIKRLAADIELIGEIRAVLSARLPRRAVRLEQQATRSDAKRQQPGRRHVATGR